MIHLYKAGGIRKTEDGLEYSIKAVNESDRDLYKANGWVKSLSDLVVEPTAEELAEIEAAKAEKAAKTKATKEANKLKKEAEELAKLEAEEAEKADTDDNQE